VDFGDVLAASCTCPPDGYEEDDAADQASDLPIGVTQAHDFCDDDTDWATFSAQAGDVYTITTSSWGQRADTYLALFDANARQLAANDDYEGTTDYSSRIAWQAPADGVYYIRTTNRAGLTRCATDYELLIEGRKQNIIYLPILVRNYDTGSSQSLQSGVLHPTGVILHTCPDAYETDDTWQQAHSIENGVVQIHSFDSDPVQYAADKDFVWFDAAAAKTITFTVTPVTSTKTLLELYDELGSALNVTGTTQLAWTPAAAGRYYLSASPLTTTFGCTHTVGYGLLIEQPVIYNIFLPLVVKVV
jgi:hypothetical protein